MVGMAAPILGFLISTLTEVEAWLRVISLLIGITVGLVTLCQKWWGRKRRQQHGHRGK
jgi:ABC-type nickel/cobalt efflux system permease component RcnA